METLPSDPDSRALPAWPVSSQERRKVQSQAISASLTSTEIRETTDDDLQLIEMRYQQMVALMNLETLFADGQLDCM
jgi:hypothetical protein